LGLVVLFFDFYRYLYIMTTITLQVPDALEEAHDETVRLIAAKLYEAGKLSLGQAAEMCGIDKVDFPAVLNSFDVNYIQYSYEDIMADVARING
jgi:predicted HTH domain antitoxin